MEDSILILNAIPENLQTEDELRGFVKQHRGCLVTVCAYGCGCGALTL